METLTKKQIQQLYDFTRRFKVQYRDVQIELVDHLASAIKEIMNDDNSISFDEALKQAHRPFGNYGFSRIVKQKEKAMEKYWVRKIRNYFLEFFHWPKIIGTISVMILLFILLKYKVLPLFIPQVVFVVFAFAAIIFIMYQNYVKDNHIRDFLYLRSFYSFATASVFAFFYLPIYLFNSDIAIVDKLILSNWYILLLSIILPSVAIVFYLIIVRIPGELKKTFYQEHKEYLELIG